MNWHKLELVYHNLFNIRFAIISAVFNGSLELAINSEKGFSIAAGIGMAQAVSSFFSTGFTARLVQHFSPIQNRAQSYLLGSFVPAAITLGLSLTAHYIHGTENPWVNSCPATLISFVTSFVTNYITRSGRMLPGNYPKARP
jgi:hypothetical protein